MRAPSRAPGARATVLLDRRQAQLLRHLRARELGGASKLLSRSSHTVRFSNFIAKAALDTPSSFGQAKLRLASYLRESVEIREIIVVHELLFALSKGGACTVFNRDTRSFVCVLNVTSDEVIRSVFHNKFNDSIITTSVRGDDRFATLQCRSISLEYVRRGEPEQGFPMFVSEIIKHPGFVEFDDVNGKIVSYSPSDAVYKVWELVNYTLVWSMSAEGVRELKISPGVLLVIGVRTPQHIPLKVLDVEDGSVLQSFSHVLRRDRRVDFIEQYDHKLMIKQEKTNLQILNIESGQVVEVENSQALVPSAFIFLHHNHLFLTFSNRQVTVWDFEGKIVTRLEDHLLWFGAKECGNTVYVSNKHELIMSICVDDSETYGLRSSLNISDMRTGKCIAKLFPNGASQVDGFERTSAIAFCSDYNELYTGNKHGQVTFWSNA